MWPGLNFKLPRKIYFLKKKGNQEKRKTCKTGGRTALLYVDYCNRSFIAGHARSITVHLSQQVQDALNANFYDEPYIVAKKRAVFFAKWSKRASELKPREEALMQSGPAHVTDIMKGKNLLLLKEIWDDLEYPDKGLFDDLCNGFKLTGWLPKSGVFPSRIKHPEYVVQTLKTLAIAQINFVSGSEHSNTESDEVAKSTWATTLDEEKLGWIWRDPDQNLEGKVVAKRLDFNRRLRFESPMTAAFVGLMQLVVSRNVSRYTPLTKCAYVVWVFSKQGRGACPKIVGKTFDLKSAYRQFCICKEDRDFARIMVFDTDKKVPTTFGLNALPFGAVGSVAGFLRVSLALHYIGVVGLHLAWTAFCDDYTIVTSLLKNSSELAAASLFDLLGIVFAKEGDK